MVTVVGIDLASSPEYGAKHYNRLGLAAIDESFNLVELTTGRFADTQIVDFVRRHRPSVVAIDSPLSLPLEGVLRDVDRVMLKRGFRPYPPLIPSMVALTRRGIALRTAFEAHGIRAIEAFPGAAQDVLGLPRKQRSRELLAAGLRRLCIRPIETLDGDALDAITASYVGHCYLSGAYEALGPPTDVQVVNPRAGERL
jgi:predicted nuclease with RNAse H fold